MTNLQEEVVAQVLLDHNEALKAQAQVINLQAEMLGQQQVLNQSLLDLCQSLAIQVASLKQRVSRLECWSRN